MTVIFENLICRRIGVEVIRKWKAGLKITIYGMSKSCQWIWSMLNLNNILVARIGNGKGVISKLDEKLEEAVFKNDTYMNTKHFLRTKIGFINKGRLFCLNFIYSGIEQ